MGGPKVRKTKKSTKDNSAVKKRLDEEAQSKATKKANKTPKEKLTAEAKTAKRRAEAFLRLTKARETNMHAFTGRTHSAAKGLPGISRPAEKVIRAALPDLRKGRNPDMMRSGTTIDAKTGARVTPEEAAKTEPASRAGRVWVQSHTPRSDGMPVTAAPTLHDYQRFMDSGAKGVRTMVMAGPEGMTTLRSRADGTWPSKKEMSDALNQAEADILNARDAARAITARGSTPQYQKDAVVGISEAHVQAAAWKSAARSLGLAFNRVGYSERRSYNMSLNADPEADIIRGGKTVEGRYGSNIQRKLRVGDVLRFNGGSSHVEITGIHTYPTAEAMVKAHGPEALGFHKVWGYGYDASGKFSAARQAQEASQQYNKIYGNMLKQAAAGKRKSEGFIAYDVRPVSADKVNEPLPVPGGAAKRARKK